MLNLISLVKLQVVLTDKWMAGTTGNLSHNKSRQISLAYLGKNSCCTDGNSCSYPAPPISRSSISSGPTSSIPLVIGVTLQHPMSAESSLSFCFHSSPPHTVAFPLHYTPRAICPCAPNTPTTCPTPCYVTSQRKRKAQTTWNIRINMVWGRPCFKAFLYTNKNRQKECRRILKRSEQKYMVEPCGACFLPVSLSSDAAVAKLTSSSSPWQFQHKPSSFCLWSTLFHLY